MAKHWRIQYEGAFHHFLSKGNEGRDIFCDDQDRTVFLEASGEMSDRFDIEMYTFILMFNHYHHFLLQTRGSNLYRAVNKRQGEIRWRLQKKVCID